MKKDTNIYKILFFGTILLISGIYVNTVYNNFIITQYEHKRTQRAMKKAENQILFTRAKAIERGKMSTGKFLLTKFQEKAYGAGQNMGY